MEGGHEEGITDILVVSLKLYIDIDINKRLRNVCACVCVCSLWASVKTAEDCGVLSSLTVSLCLSGGIQGAEGNCSLMWGICSHIC